MKNQVIISTVAFVMIIIFSFFILSQQDTPTDNTTPPPTLTDEIILFYGEGCPHCIIVDNYIENNDIKQQIKFAHKEVYYNQENSQELIAKAKQCGLSTNSIGVPLLWDGQNCLIGDKNIIQFFQQKINVN